MDKKLKKLKRYIKKEWNIKDMDIRLSDTILNVSERIVMKSENCSLEEAYKKWILKETLHLPGWVGFYIVDEFCNDFSKLKMDSTINDLLESR